MDRMDETHEHLKKLLKQERVAKEICAALNAFVELKSVLIEVIERISSLTGCEAVSIRLHDDGDYPYYVYHGFPESFIRHENSLCAKDEAGESILEANGKGYLLECMCGNIIRGRYDPSLPFFTKKGSFWSNNTSALLASTTEGGRQGRTRNYCNSCGFESVALIPIKAQSERIGLIQLNDMRTGMFNEDIISFMEMIGEQIGLAVQNSLIYTKLKKATEEIKILRGLLTICAACKKIRDDKGSWLPLETYIRAHSESEFTHGICPDCHKRLYPDLFP